MYTPLPYIRDIFRKSRPIHLTFFVTRRCNSHCPFCFYLRSDEPAPSGSELSLDEITKISSSLGSLLWLAFSGGEIFLRDDLVEIARTFYRRNRPAIMLFPTNGLLPDVISGRIGEIARSCPKSVVALKLSVDGIGPAHDSLRRTPGSFDKVMQTYRAAADLVQRHPNLELGVNTVFCSANQDAMDDIIDFVGKLDASRTHTISLVRGNLADRQFSGVDQGKYVQAVARLEENLKGRKSPVYRFAGGRIKAAQDILQRRLIAGTLSGAGRAIPCFAGRLNVVMGETGEIFPCEIRGESFGNVRDFGYDLRKVMQSAVARRVIGEIRDKGCSCTHECYVMTNILFNPRLYPALFREYLHVRPRA